MCWTDFVVESPTAKMAMTEPTPMMSPNIVSRERSRLFQMTSSACARNSRTLFMAQTFDRRERGGARRRIGAEEEPDGHGEADRGGEDREPVDGRRLTRDRSRDERICRQSRAHTQSRADHASYQRDGDGLHQELRQDVAARRADSLADADLARALDDRD